MFGVKCGTYKQPQPRGIPGSPSLSASRADTRRGLRGLPWNRFLSPGVSFRLAQRPMRLSLLSCQPHVCRGIPAEKLSPKLGSGYRSDAWLGVRSCCSDSASPSPSNHGSKVLWRSQRKAGAAFESPRPPTRLPRESG